MRRPPLVPRDPRETRPLVWVIAIMTLMAALAGAAALSLAREARAWASGFDGRVLVTLPAGADAQAEAAQALLGAEPAITSVRLIARADAVALIRPWIGEGDDTALPVPLILEAAYDTDAAPDFAGLTARLRAAAPDAAIETRSAWRAQIEGAADTLALSALGVLALIASATAAVVVFAMRASLIAHREIVDVLHLTGARDHTIAGAFAWQAFLISGRAALIGVGLAAIVLGAAVAAARALPEAAPAFLPGMTLRFADWAVLLAAPAGVVAISVLTSGLTIWRSLVRTP